ncbi:MAG: 3-isopropylmalate dehydratase large subunit [Anaerolineales bacterium]
MGKTFAEKIFARNTGQLDVRPGQILEIHPDVALSHDNTAAIFGIFGRMGATRVCEPDKLAVFLDHAAPAPTTKHAENHRIIRQFAADQGVDHFYDVGRGICHQVLVEEGLALPGEIVLGSDSHTPHAGVMGAFGAGIGRSEMASIWALGSIWLRVPESMNISVHNTLPMGVTTKDLALYVVGKIGADGALYMSVEWHGEAIEQLDLSQRAVLPNMMAEAGAKNSYVPPDELVHKFLDGRAVREYEAIHPDSDADYAIELSVDAGAIEPMVACPHAVDNVKPLSEVAGIKVDQAFLGTCTNGRLEDIEAAAKIVKGKRISPNTRLIVIPASSQIYLEAMRLGYLETLLESGAIIESPGCGPCMGNHLGVPAEGEVTISSANRNFQGRMGTKNSEIYLASPQVVAASAIAGEIIHPAELG